VDLADLLDPRVLVILLFQATGVAFLVFLFLQESRNRGRVRYVACQFKSVLTVCISMQKKYAKFTECWIL
jgi:hypothetical protein